MGVGSESSPGVAHSFLGGGGSLAIRLAVLLRVQDWSGSLESGKLGLPISEEIQ